MRSQQIEKIKIEQRREQTEHTEKTERIAAYLLDLDGASFNAVYFNLIHCFILERQLREEGKISGTTFLDRDHSQDDFDSMIEQINADNDILWPYVEKQLKVYEQKYASQLTRDQFDILKSQTSVVQMLIYGVLERNQNVQVGLSEYIIDLRFKFLMRYLDAKIHGVFFVMANAEPLYDHFVSEHATHSFNKLILLSGTNRLNAYFDFRGVVENGTGFIRDLLSLTEHLKEKLKREYPDLEVVFDPVTKSDFETENRELGSNFKDMCAITDLFVKGAQHLTFMEKEIWFGLFRGMLEKEKDVAILDNPSIPSLVLDPLLEGDDKYKYQSKLSALENLIRELKKLIEIERQKKVYYDTSKLSLVCAAGWHLLQAHPQAKFIKLNHLDDMLVEIISVLEAAFATHPDLFTDRVTLGLHEYYMGKIQWSFEIKGKSKENEFLDTPQHNIGFSIRQMADMCDEAIKAQDPCGSIYSSNYCAVEQLGDFIDYKISIQNAYKNQYQPYPVALTPTELTPTELTPTELTPRAPMPECSSNLLNSDGDFEEISLLATSKSDTGINYSSYSPNSESDTETDSSLDSESDNEEVNPRESFEAIEFNNYIDGRSEVNRYEEKFKTGTSFFSQSTTVDANADTLAYAAARVSAWNKWLQGTAHRAVYTLQGATASLFSHANKPHEKSAHSREVMNDHEELNNSSAKLKH